MQLHLTGLALLLAASLHASSSNVIVLASAKQGDSPVSVTAPAQYLSAEIRIESNEDDWSLKLSGIDDARGKLIAAAEKESFKVRIEQALIFSPRYSSFSFSKSSPRDHEALTDVLLLAPLTGDSNLIQIVKKFRSIISGLKSERKVDVSLGSIALALENPEALRPELLKKIRGHIESSGTALFENPAPSVTGLDEPLRVRQSGERTVEVYLPFRVVYAKGGAVK